MRLVAVSIVKNEADIIEPFVRHTRAWVDHHLIFDHDSTDGTREILGALQREGLPISLYTDDALGNLQQARSNHLVRLAAQSFAADWILPLDADEILTGPGRATLEKILAASGSDQPASLRLLNYYPSTGDDAAETNPVRRLHHCSVAPAQTKKIIVPRQLALDEQTVAGKGSHALHCGPTPLPDRPLPEVFHLAHLALRSPQHQVLRVVLAELQKLSRGQAHAGLDTHYHLGFQLLAEDPDLFFATIGQPVTQLRLQPIAYFGTPLLYSSQAVGWKRIARALLPYLDRLASSHGRLLDGEKAAPDTAAQIRELTASDIPALDTAPSRGNFTGFIPLAGWGPQEGPVPEAFLPPFHWGFAPFTQLAIESTAGQPACLVADVLTYSESQAVTIELNGHSVGLHAFTHTNHKERLVAPLTLRLGRNELILRYSQCLVTDYDSRKLAVIFLSLRILSAKTS